MNKKGKKSMFHIRTLRQRMSLILSVCMILCFLLVVSVSYISLQAAEKNRIETTMQADLLQLTGQIDSDYYTLVQLSQQMSLEGSVGRLVNNYVTQSGGYERIEISGRITSDINTMLFSHENISLVGYFSDGTAVDKPEKMLFFSLPVKENSNPLKLGTIVQTNTISLNSIHRSLNYSSSKDVVSLTRRVRFSDDKDYLIYGEIFTGAKKNIQSLSQIRKVSYDLLQVDNNGRICFSSSDAFKAGDSINVDKNAKNGTVQASGEFTYLSAVSKFGFNNVLLVPETSYHQQMNSWQLSVFFVFIAAVILVSITGFLLVHLIYRPLQILGRDMLEVGKGNIVPGKHSFQIDEFDNLFKRFDDMKQEVVQLLENVRQQEKEKQQLEIDKLYYQINPHFLMNVLHSVHCMANINKQPEIERFIYKLNYILGYSLGKTNAKATFRTELKYLKLYLELQKERYDFEVWLNIEEGDYLDAPCARFIMQPLAENAVCHNINEFGNLWIEIGFENENYVMISIKDDGHGFNPEGYRNDMQTAGSLNKGIGLRYVEMSLLSFYGSDAKLNIKSEPEEGTVVTLLLPVRKGNEPYV